MKHLLLVIVLCALVLVSLASALTVDFQEPSDLTNIAGFGTSAGSVLTYNYNTTGGNSFVLVQPNAFPGTYGIINAVASPMTHAEGTLLYETGGASSTYAGIELIGPAPTYTVLFDAFLGATPAPSGRYEFVMNPNNSASVYYQGGLIATSGVLATNPSYVMFGVSCAGAPQQNAAWDDLVWGSTDPTYVFDMPEQNQYIIMKDLISPNSGFAWANGTQIGFTMPVSFSKDNGNDEKICLQEISTGLCYSNFSTVAGNYFGSRHFNVDVDVVDSGAPYGFYRMYSPNTTANYNTIKYIANGASVAFNRDNYSQDDTGYVDYTITAGYWLPATYTYKMSFLNVYGQFIGNETISTQSGTIPVVFTASSYPPGVYYAELIAHNIATGVDAPMNYDSTEVLASIPLSGHVYDSNTTLALSGVLYNISQLSTWSNGSTDATGTFSSSGWLTGSQIHYYFTKTGYTPFNYSFTPLSARNVSLNISLCPTAPLTGGRAIGGIARETTYGSYLPSVTVLVTNTTTGESYTNLTNIRGGYKCDAGYSCVATLTPSRMYSVQGTKTGYNASAVYNVVVV